MKKQKMLIIGGVVALLFVGVGVLAVSLRSMGKKNDVAASPAPKKRSRVEPNALPLAERPYIKISPLADGRNLTISVSSVKKPADFAEYELEYQAGSLLQGAFGQIDLGTSPAEAKILLGSCSAGGACTYHQDVQGGTLLTTFQESSGEEGDTIDLYAFKSRWKYIDNAKSETELSSQDAKFVVESAGLKRQRFVVIFNTAGYPEGLEGTPVSEVYSLATSNDLSGDGKVTIRANETGELKIMGWDGSSWVELDTTIDDKTTTATGKLMELYVVVK